jgi:Bacterial PH domain
VRLSLGGGAIDAEDQKVLDRELTSDERLLWASHPRRGIRFAAYDLFLIPFSLFWCGGVLTWAKGVLATHAPGLFSLWGVPFVGFGLYLAVGRFFGDALRRKRIAYGLTSKRIIIVSGTFSRQVRSVELATLGETSLSERSDGSGTIMLGAASGPGSLAAGLMARSWASPSRVPPPMLEMIEYARAVDEMIRAAKT